LALAYFGNLRPSSSGSVLESAVPIAPAVNVAPVMPAVPASGAAQIPAK
jgi:preprotein translocase subunit SecG